MKLVNKKNYRFLSVFLITLSMVMLNGCADKNTVFIDDSIPLAEKGLLDPKSLIEKGKKRSEEAIKTGPIPVEITDRIVKNSDDNLINREKTSNYVVVDKNKSFNISINVENMDIRTFMKMLSNIISTNILVSDEVKGYVTANLKDVPWPTVLDSVLSIKQLAKHVDHKANLIRIHDQETIVSLESFDRKRIADQQKTSVLEKSAMPMTTKTFKLFYTEPEKMKELLQGVLENETSSANSLSVRDTTAQITIDDRVNQLIIKARENDFPIIETLILKTDIRTKQVYIEAFIVEATDGFEKALGTRLGLLASDISASGRGRTLTSGQIAGIGGGTVGTIAAGASDSSLADFAVGNATSGISLLGTLDGTTQLKLELTAMESEGLTKVISNPRIYTLDNQEAIIFQGTEVPYETVSQDGTQIEFKEAGLRLAVTPSVVGDGNLMLSIKVNKDTVDTSIANPPITKSEIITNLISKDGSIVVIGGIYSQSHTKSKDQVPLLGDIPIFGKLFSRSIKSDDKQELLIFIAPKIL